MKFAAARLLVSFFVAGGVCWISADPLVMPCGEWWGVSFSNFNLGDGGGGIIGSRAGAASISAAEGFQVLQMLS